MAAAGILFCHAAFAALFSGGSKKFYTSLTTHAVMQFHCYSRRNSHVDNCQYADIYFFHLQCKITSEFCKCTDLYQANQILTN